MVDKDSKKPIILLDLDQTCLSAESLDEYDVSKNAKKAKKFTSHNMDGYYIIFERPNLQEFLDYLFSNFRVSIWTAASKDYAVFIIENMILPKGKERRLEHIFFCNHCDISKKYRKGASKDLKTMWKVFNLEEYNTDNCFILDDYDEVYETQPENCIFAHPFEFTSSSSHKDNYLPKLQKLLPNLLKRYKNNGSVKVAVKEINISLK